MSIEQASKVPPYPLPKDYYDLTAEGRRLARVSVLLKRETPRDYCDAYHWMVHYYLNHDQCGFFKDFTETPPVHYKWVSCLRSVKRMVAIAAPRGFSKSTALGKIVPLIEIVAPLKRSNEVGLFLAKDSFVEDRFDELMQQLENNERIKQDFGTLRPGKGFGVWNRHLLRLTNGSKLRGFSMDGIKRGARPDLIIIDDPEFDPKTGTNLVRVSDDLDNMLKREIVPMLPPKGRLLWIGTLLHRRSYLYQIFNGDDKAFKNWEKHIDAADWTDKATGKRTFLWENRFDASFLDGRKDLMGAGAYAGEYGNDPRSDAEAMLQIDPVLNEYQLVEEGDWTVWPQTEDAPLSSQKKIRFYDCGVDEDKVVVPSLTTEKFGEWVRSLRRFMLVDYAPTDNVTSDFSACVVVGLDHRNTVWVLDAWQDRVRPDALIRMIWAMGRKWAVELIGVESVGIQSALAAQVQDVLTAMTRPEDYWYPQVKPITYPYKVSKSDRIAGLEWRFLKGRIKLPGYAKNARNHWLAKLIEQIMDFTMDLSRLPKDDLVDALSMFHYLVMGSHTPMDVPNEKKTAKELLLSGEVFFPGTQIQTLHAIPRDEWTPDVMQKLEQMKFEREQDFMDLNESGRAVHQEDDNYRQGDPGWIY